MDLAHYVIVAAVIAVLAVMLFFGYRKQRDGNWHPAGANRMRRLGAAGWDYRPMTQQEYDESQADRAAP